MIIIKNTKSLCPICLKVVDAEVYEDEGKILIKKHALNMENLLTRIGAIQRFITKQRTTKK